MEKGTRELHTGPDAIAAVPCPLRFNEQIAMGRCVEYQRDAGCHCQHALVALRRTERFLTAPVNVLSAYDTTARADALDGVRTLIERAEQLEKARPPATPAPPPKAQRLEMMRQRLQVPCKPAESQKPAFTTQEPITPAPPAKESSMPNYKGRALTATDDEVRRAYEEGGGSINKTMEKLGTTSWAAVKKRVVGLGLKAGAPAAKPSRKPKMEPVRIDVARAVNGKAVPVRGLPHPRSLAEVVAKHTPVAQPGDVIQLLEHQLAHHQEQADKCERALAALRT